MSSHHVIRDEQEPPLIILDQTFDFEIVNQLLGWSPMVIVEASLLKYFNARKIRIDGIICLDGLDEHSIENTDGISIYYFQHLDSGILHTIVGMLAGKDYTGLNVFCNDDARTQLLREAEGVKKYNFPLNIFVNSEKTIIAFKQSINKWYVAGQKLNFNTERISCSSKLKEKAGFLEIIETGKHQFVSSESVIAITEY